MVVRYGGDEFICGFPALDVNDAAERFAHINEDLAASDEASVAFGLAELERGDSLTGLIARADALMYANRYQRIRDPEREPGAPQRPWARSPRAPSNRGRIGRYGLAPGRSATASSTSAMVSRARVRWISACSAPARAA